MDAGHQFSRGLIVVPAYNEIASLADVVAAIRTASKQDLLVVDDGSTDGTATWLRDAGVPHVRHLFNLGYGAALETGMLFALRHGYQYAVFLDGDGQHDPAELGSLVDALAAGADLVIGSRYLAGYSGQPAARRLGSIVFSWLTAIGGQRVFDTTSGFKALSRETMARTLEGQFGDYHAEFLYHLIATGARIREVPIHAGQRRAGRSMYGLLGACYYPLKTALLALSIFLRKRS
jgi:glycosyltransferase involved in cell wall biosynthesis